MFLSKPDWLRTDCRGQVTRLNLKSRIYVVRVRRKLGRDMSHVAAHRSPEKECGSREKCIAEFSHELEAQYV